MMSSVQRIDNMLMIDHLMAALRDILPLAEYGFDASENEECCGNEYGCGCRSRAREKIDRAGKLLYG